MSVTQLTRKILVTGNQTVAMQSLPAVPLLSSPSFKNHLPRIILHTQRPLFWKTSKVTMLTPPAALPSGLPFQYYILSIILPIYVDFSCCCLISRLVDSLNSTTCCCSKIAFIQPQLDFFRSKEKPNLLHYLLVLRCSMHMFWIQSMPSMPYGYMGMPIGWNVLSMPSEGCSLCMPIVIINFKVRGVK